MKISTFIDTDFKEYSLYDAHRSIPNLMDGLKTVQRKVLYTAVQHSGKIKTSQLGAKAAELTRYHHGESSIIDASVGMGKDYPGSNNAPLMEKIGQFGNRLNHDHSSPRYISARLSENYQQMFSSEDNDILNYLEDDGDTVEPQCFLPSIPLVLVNGANGRCPGFNCVVFHHTVKDVRRAVLETLKYGCVQTPLVPMYNGFSGTVSREADGSQIVIKGVLEVENTTTIVIKELPLKWQQNKYKLDVLNPLIESKVIKSYTNKSTATGWHWIIKCPRETTKLPIETLHKEFGIIERKSPTINLWNADQTAMLTLTSPEDVVHEFCKARLPLYQQRKDSMLQKLSVKIRWSQIKMAFIKGWRSGGQETCKDLSGNELLKAVFVMVMDRLDKSMLNGVGLKPDEIKKLLQMPIGSLTVDNCIKLGENVASLIEEYNSLNGTEIQHMWVADLKRIK